MVSLFKGKVLLTVVYALTCCLTAQQTLSEAQAVAQTKNTDDIRAFFGSERAHAALDSLKIDRQRVDEALAKLSPDDLARVAQNTRQLQKDLLVSPSELRAAITVAAQSRTANLANVRAFFASDRIRTALQSHKVDYRRIDKAIATLSPDDLALISARTQQIQENFAAGQTSSNDDWLYWLLGIVLVLVIIILLVCVGKKNPNACSDNAG